uniref:Condensin-2 complex subunit H2 n=1 Tax=Amphilophus citrinellus TaxID=61819 RepID=A0A3Q0QZJ3_AMPCI
MESTESRYAHLLQPIRELTKNWEIDLASELNDYLEELDDMCIIFDGGKTRLNFAEAALLIQGSACIYSKKVELLHSLVFQTLEYISDKNKKRNKQGAESQDSNGQAASSHDADDMDEVKNTHMLLKIFIYAVNVIPLPPESLIAPEPHEKQKLPLISVKGEILCSQKDFKINLFLPGEGDMILLTLRSTAPRFLLHIDAAVGGADAEDGGGDAADDFLPIEVQNMEQEEHVERLQTVIHGRVSARFSSSSSSSVTLVLLVNVWAFHDPYAVLGEDKPLKPGKCYRVPDGLDEGGKRKRKRAASLQDFRSWFRGTFDPPDQFVFKPLESEHMTRYYHVCDVTQGVMISDEELRRTFLQPEEAGPHQVGAEPVEELRQDLLGKFGFRLVVNSRGYNQETALSRRVKDWEEKICPELALQEERPVFDIHDYGDRIVRALSGVGYRRSFASIVHGLDNFEASKYLLASLQLANDYTVEIDSGAGLEDGLDTMGLTLLSTHRATDRFHTLTAST